MYRVSTCSRVEHCLAGPGQLLDGVHDFDLFGHPEALEQRLVGELVDAGLVAAQIDGNPVGLLVIERRE